MPAPILRATPVLPHGLMRWQDLIRECIAVAPGCEAKVNWSDLQRTVLQIQANGGKSAQAYVAPLGDAISVNVCHPQPGAHADGALLPNDAQAFSTFVPNLRLAKAELLIFAGQAEPASWERLKEYIEARRQEIEELLDHSMLILDVELQSSRLMMVLELMTAPTILLDEDASVRFFNSAAKTLLVQKRHVSLSRQNQIQLPDAAKTREFRKQVKELSVSQERGQDPIYLRYRPTESAALDFVRLSTVPSIAVKHCEHPEILSGTVKAEFFVSQPTARISAETIQKVFGITASESKLAEALCQGLTLDGYAEREGIAISTARWHLHNVLTRTETRSQAELIRLLLTILH
ncbi:MAG: hypothetical protein ABL894_05435 [Hyphomicrobium sp.]